MRLAPPRSSSAPLSRSVRRNQSGDRGGFSVESAVALRTYLSMMDNYDEVTSFEERMPPSRSTSASSTASSSLALGGTLHEDLEELLSQSLDDFAGVVTTFQQRQQLRHKQEKHTASDKSIQRLPRARILKTDKAKFAHDESECGICCGRLIDGIALTRLPCGHIYHFNCAFPWLAQKSNTCPECRYELPTSDAKYEAIRQDKMKGRKTVSCKCIPSSFHSCFFVDPSKSIKEQLNEDEEQDNEIVVCRPVTPCEDADKVEAENSLHRFM